MSDIVEQLLGSCIGTPATIPWPHSLLHDAVKEIRALRATNARLVEGIRLWRDAYETRQNEPLVIAYESTAALAGAAKQEDGQ